MPPPPRSPRRGSLARRYSRFGSSSSETLEARAQLSDDRIEADRVAPLRGQPHLAVSERLAQLVVLDDVLARQRRDTCWRR
jgi:hypothetical protein